MLLLLGVLLLQDPVGDLIRRLDDDDIHVRRKAADELVARGRSAEEALWTALGEGSLETSLAVEEILSRMGRLEKRTRALRELLTGRKPVCADVDAGLLYRGRVATVTDERRFGKLKDDPPSVSDR